MSMIGLFTAGTHAATATTATDDPAAAGGFGAALQGALDALTGAADNASEQPAAMPLDELGATPPIPTDAPAAAGRVVEGEILDPGLVLPSSASAATSDLPLLEPAGIHTDAPVPAPVLTDSANATPLVELVETPTGDSLPVSTTSASSVPLVGTASTQPVPSDAPAAILTAATRTPSGSPLAVSPGSASNPATIPPAEVAQTSASTPVPASGGSVNDMQAAPPAEVAETTAASTVPISPQTARPTEASAAVPQVQPLEARIGSAVPASTSFASAPASATVTASARGLVETTAQVPTVVASPSSTPAPSVTPATPVAAPTPAASAPLATQLARPIFSLAAAGTGQHVMTVSVTPDNLGPVTLRAHVGADGVRVELFAPNDIGRDAIRAIIPELRRDLAGAGLGGNLTLSPQSQPSAGSDHSASGQSGAEPGDRDGVADLSASGADRSGSVAPSAEPDSRPKSFGTSTIDVLA